MVGVAGLEPAASWSRTKRDTKLRHTPATFVIIPTYLMFVKCYFQRGVYFKGPGVVFSKGLVLYVSSIYWQGIF